MAQAQGFDLSANFSESSDGASDRRIIGNLIETGFEDDAVLFANNLRDFSELPSEVYQVTGGLISISADGYLPYSDTTELLLITYPDNASKVDQVNGAISAAYEVYESNALSSFRIRDENGVPVSTGFNGALQALRRKDVVRFVNLSNLKATRIPSIAPALSGEALAGEGNISVLDEFEILTVYDNVDSSVSTLAFTKSSIPRVYEDSVFNAKNLVFQGNIRILNTQNISVNDPAQAAVAPGLYIKAGDSPKRAFSDTSNPWSEVNDANVGPALSTQATETTIGKMIMYGSTPEFRGTWPGSANTGDTGSITDWTHKIPVKINNGASTVFLLVKT
mgnify:CR=1 FL=1|tara:strand:- start:531 stop:1535 length:1005 start_codon:yes stop_codon:yes gene_type:complete